MIEYEAWSDAFFEQYDATTYGAYNEEELPPAAFCNDDFYGEMQ